ncbi:MAG TPA: YidC/Oxa1 family insertase periplasmic-domain containing protein [Holophagaceae bacterium]|nr:YidC/Oxa1 family insertase periplasmic-domain containing protein [Holophagaceae bacterium]
MKQKNFIFFLLGTVALFGLQIWLSRRFAPQPQPAQTVQAEPQAPGAAPAAPASPAPAALPAPAQSSAPAATRTFSNSDLKLTWRQSDGALLQAEWKDGTRFFPETFLGLGGLTIRDLDRVTEAPTATGTVLTFSNASGDEVSYEIPKEGHVLQVGWRSARATALEALPAPAELSQVEGLGRVFTLDEKALKGVTWSDTLKDPFFSFLGAKRKVLPEPQARLGLDAGLEHAQKVQTTHYFAALWKLPKTPRLDAAGYRLPAEAGGLQAQLYLGPKEQASLAAFEKPFTQVMDFGFFGAVAQLLFVLLRLIQRVVPDWGWSIVLFTLLLRVALWWPNTKQTRSMLRMKDFEPHQKALQAKYEKFGNDMTKKAEMQKELMELYKKNGHNPFGGCLPVLLQMPVLFALWSMLRNVYELRHAPWAATWIHDLSAKDPHYVLPVALGLSMVVQSAVTPAMGDPAQRKMMMFMMPAMMVFMFAQAPAGLCLYYFVFNVVGLLQILWVSRSYVPEPIKV